MRRLSGRGMSPESLCFRGFLAASGATARAHGASELVDVGRDRAHRGQRVRGADAERAE